MLTDTQLTSTATSARYAVSVNSKRQESPRVTLRVDADTAKEAREFGHEFALRILNFKRSDYYLLVEKLGA